MFNEYVAEQNYSYPPDDFDREADAAEHFGAHRAEEPFLQRNLVPLLIAAALLVIVIVTASFLLSGRGTQEPSSAPAATAEQTTAPGTEDGSETAADPSPSAPDVDKSEVEVAVVNGVGISGLAGRWSDAIEAEDWQTGYVGNAGEDYDENTVVYNDPDVADHARALAAEFGISAVEESDEFEAAITIVAKSEPPQGDAADSGEDGSAE